MSYQVSSCRLCMISIKQFPCYHLAVARTVIWCKYDGDAATHPARPQPPTLLTPHDSHKPWSLKTISQVLQTTNLWYFDQLTMMISSNSRTRTLVNYSLAYSKNMNQLFFWLMLLWIQNFSDHKNLRFRDQKSFGQKQWVWKIFGPKNLEPKKIGSKIILDQKNFGSKES